MIEVNSRHRYMLEDKPLSACLEMERDVFINNKVSGYH